MYTVEDFILEEIAKAQDMFYGSPSRVVLVSDDSKRLERYQYVLELGTIFQDGGGAGSWYGDTRNYDSINRGYYRWLLMDREAYTFCKKILPYLAKYDKRKFPYCQQLMMEYMAREGNPDRLYKSKSA